MENALCFYSSYHKKLISFVQELPLKLKHDSPQELTNVRYILQVVDPSEKDFYSGAEDILKKKVIKVLQMTERVLKGVNRFVRPDEHWWVRSKAYILNTFARFVKLSLFESSGYKIDDVTFSGIGSANMEGLGQPPLLEQHLQREIDNLMTVLD